jgi:dihydroxyacetone kinase-like protein
VPSAGKPTFEIPDDMMEMGVRYSRRTRAAPRAARARNLSPSSWCEPVLADLDFTDGPTIVMLQRHGRLLIELYLMLRRGEEDPPTRPA